MYGTYKHGPEDFHIWFDWLYKIYKSAASSSFGNITVIQSNRQIRVMSDISIQYTKNNSEIVRTEEQFTMHVDLKSDWSYQTFKNTHQNITE